MIIQEVMQMNVFVDADVIVSFFDEGNPHFQFSHKLIAISASEHFEVFVSPISLGKAFKSASKKCGKAKAKEIVDGLLDSLNVTTIDDGVVNCAAINNDILDFEAGIQFYSALDDDCEVIVTENKDNYCNCKIELLTCEEFLEKYELNEGVYI